MYGSAGPPKKYSTPRGVDDSSAAKRICQKCSSKAHWTFECKEAAARTSTTARLSRTQQQRWGIKQRRQEFVPEPTEWEAYKERVKGVEQQLMAEVREEKRKKVRCETTRRTVGDTSGDDKEAQKNSKLESPHRPEEIAAEGKAV
ncbi:putative Zinc knuckle [Trypanosoma vivax]|uniref:Zinc knuckle n=1 Tax=Trypanosoma vivax (strain Y486) TaxID=1055687 RepID=G0TTT2_TRYVY|nr:hypothetical protein TRVL_00067 [Trypanosoma vivax]KAH8613866.1 putative Zinc knuckle [Trypanosoma vivax]CCC47363.1 conserved hypothetical protein [Trypanosoma vivax Y486]